jgi:hypothetical protein
LNLATFGGTMNNADKDRQSLVFADGYSYTEIFQAPETSGMPSSGRLISVFHAFFTNDHDTDIVEATKTEAPPAEVIELVTKDA